MPELPPIFLERLPKIIPAEHRNSVLESFGHLRSVVVRINSLKAKCEDVLRQLKDSRIVFQTVSWSRHALVLTDYDFSTGILADLEKNGVLYRQSLSSQLVPLILDPRPGERVLDMCAAPGSKTTQIAELMRNQGEVTAVENIRRRLYKLKSVVTLLGAENVRVCFGDGRRFQSAELFDKILLDAPCSSEGRFHLSDLKTFRYWSPRKIKEMVRKQRGLLRHAARLLKPGGVLVYSTCTFGPEENEGVLDWVLKKSEGQLDIVPVDFTRRNGIPVYPAVTVWKDREYDPRVQGSVRILPGNGMDGFFLARLIKRPPR